MEPCTLVRVSEHLYWYTPDSRTDRASLAAVVGARGTLLLDIGASDAHTRAFLAALAAEGVPPVRYAALTHWHWDHSFGAQALPPHVPIFAHVDTARALAEQAGYAWDDSALDARVANGQEIAFCAEMIKLEMPDRSGLRVIVPDVTFERGLHLDLGGVTCRIEHVGGDHAADSCVMFVPEDGVLFVGDALYANIHAISPLKYYTAAGVLALLDRIAAFGATRYIEGHHDVASTADEMREFTEMLARMAGAVERGETPEAANDDEREYVTWFMEGIGR